MVGREVHTLFGDAGVVLCWEPLGPALCDVLVDVTGRGPIWMSSHTLRASDGSLLPSRHNAQEQARELAEKQLRAIQAKHVEECQRARWVGCEFGKAHVGRMLDTAIDLLRTVECGDQQGGVEVKR